MGLTGGINLYQYAPNPVECRYVGLARSYAGKQ
nr:hypothetical protein [Pelistega indica]